MTARAFQSLVLSVVAGAMAAACGRSGERQFGERLDPSPSSLVGPAGSASSHAEMRGPPRRIYSLIELIANPRLFQGVEVSVQGFLVLDKVHKDEDDGTLYLERESARMNLTGNAVSVRFGACPVRLSLSDEKLVTADPEVLPALPGYVAIHGIFEPAPNGAIIGGGTICAITAVIGRDDPEQGIGASSWWNRSRPGKLAVPAPALGGGAR
jgi:hypothetical protein